MNLIILGAVIMAAYTVSLFFLRFWKVTGDRFFLFFCMAFFCEATSRLIMGLIKYPDEYEPLVYCIRLLAFVIILWAIVDKNRQSLRTLGS